MTTSPSTAQPEIDPTTIAPNTVVEVESYTTRRALYIRPDADAGEQETGHKCEPYYSRSECGQCGWQEQWCATCSRQMCGCATGATAPESTRPADEHTGTVALDLDAAEPEPPNAVEVDESGCSCKIGPYRGFQRCPIDPACPKHGEPLRHGDGDVRVFHPDGSTSIIREPSEAEHLESLACAVASVTPCSCSAQRARAEAAEAEVVTLRAKVAEVEALADQWADRKRSDGMSGNAWIGITLAGVAADLRAALATTGEGQ